MESVTDSKQLLNYSKTPAPRAARAGGAGRGPWALARLAATRGWLLVATLGALLAAIAAPGGIQNDFIRYIPLSYVYFVSGRRHRQHQQQHQHQQLRGSCRRLLLTLLHAHVLSPAVVAALVALWPLALDHRLAEGVLLSSVGAPCGWLTLAADVSPAALPALVLSQLVALTAAPTAALFICGKASVPPLGASLRTILLAAPPYAVGFITATANDNSASITTTTAALNKLSNKLLNLFSSNNIQSQFKGNDLVTYSVRKSLRTDDENHQECYSLTNICNETSGDLKLECDLLARDWQSTKQSSPRAPAATNAALPLAVALLLYCELSERLQEAAGALPAHDVLHTMLLVVCCTLSSAALGACYRRAGTSALLVRDIVAVALPRCMDAGWQSSVSCVSHGLARLPAAFSVAAHALLLGALALALGAPGAAALPTPSQRHSPT